MKIYIAGNFAVMGNIEEERKFRKVCGDKYTRLASYFYTKEANVVMDIEKGLNGTSKRKFKKKKGGKKW